MAVLLGVLPASSFAQCIPHWLPGQSIPGTTGAVYATLALPSGDVLVGGAFTMAGGVSANNIARWRASTGAWSPIGTGVGGSVFALLQLPDGTVLVAGSFSFAGVVARNIARLDPSTGAWNAIGQGIVGNDVDALALMPASAGGDVVAVGDFDSAGGIPVNGVARLNPTTGQWSSMNIGITRGLHAVAAHPNGDVYVGGTFGPGGFSAAGIARWNAASNTWSALGTGLLGGVASAIAILPNGDVVAGGPFTIAGSVAANGLARWSITSNSWSLAAPFGAGITGGAHTVNALLVLPSPPNAPAGDLIVGGNFGTPGSNIAWWHSSTGTWSAIASGLSGPCTALSYIPGALPGTPDIVVGGGFATAGGLAASNVARVEHVSSTWSGFGSGVDGAASAIAILPATLGGDAFVGGQFTRAGTTAASNIARYHAPTNAWTPLAGGVDGQVSAIAITPAGDVIVGGSFNNIRDGGPAGRIARWSPGLGSWSTLGSGIGVQPVAGQVLALVALGNGDVVAAGAFASAGGNPAGNIARWNASTSTWSTLGSGTDSSINALAMLPNGDLIAGGIFTRAGGVPNVNGLARWSGTTHSWSAAGGGVNASVYALLALPGGDLLVGGDFTSVGGAAGSSVVAANCIARWNPTTNVWSALAQGVDFQVSALALAGSEVVVGGQFGQAGPYPANRIARWNLNTSTWTIMSTGFNAPVNAVGVLPGGVGNGNVLGDIIAGGAFTTAGGQPSAYFARWTSHPACAADFDCNGTLNTQDIFAFLAAWFAGSTAADTNGVNGLEVQDVLEYLGMWFAGC